MADTKFSALTNAATLTGNENVPVIQALAGVKTTTQAIANLATAANATFTPAGTAAVLTTVQAKLRQTVSVMDFGAKGDGVADDTTAIQTAINSSLGGFITIYFPSGTYKITASLLIPVTWYYGRLTGLGISSILSMSGSSFDLITFTSAGVGVLSLLNVVIDNLALNGNAIAGSGNLINTQYASNVQMRDLYFLNLCTTGNGINVIGNGSTYSHDILISNLYYSVNTGNAVVYMGATSSDSIVERLKGNGNNGCSYGIYFATGSSHNHCANIHPYNHLINSCYIGANGSSIWFMDSRFENNLADCIQLNGSINCSFTACQFTYPPTSFGGVLLNNATNNKFVNCTFAPNNGVSAYAVKETGASNNNIFNTIVLEAGSYTASPFVILLGTESAWRVQGTDWILAGTATVAAGQTWFIGMGLGATAEASVELPVSYPCVSRKLSVQTTTAPGAGQNYTITVRDNSTNTAHVAVISGAASFSAVVGGFVNIPIADFISIQIVGSAACATGTLRATLVVNQ